MLHFENRSRQSEHIRKDTQSRDGNLNYLPVLRFPWMKIHKNRNAVYTLSRLLISTITFEKHTRISKTWICQKRVIHMLVRCSYLRRIRFYIPSAIRYKLVACLESSYMVTLYWCSSENHITGLNSHKIIPRNSTQSKSCGVKTCSISSAFTTFEVEKRTQIQVKSAQTKM